MRAQPNSRWRFAVLPIVLLSVLAPKLMPHTLPSPWVVLLAAAALLVTIPLVGMHSWRRAKVDNA